MPGPTLVPHQLTQHVKFLHKVALISNDQVLILKRSPQAKSRPGKWDLAGGNSEWPQHLAVSNQPNNPPQLNLHQADIAREIQEETGLKIPAQLFTQERLVYFATYFSPRQQLYSINCGWSVKLKQDLGLNAEAVSEPKQIVLSHEHTQYAWVKQAQVKDYDFGSPDRDYETAIIRRSLGSLSS